MITMERLKEFSTLPFNTKLFREPSTLNSREAALFIPSPEIPPRLTEHPLFRDNYYAIITRKIIAFKKLRSIPKLQRNRDDLLIMFWEQKETLCRDTLLNRFVFQIETPFENEWQAYYFLKTFSVFWRECYFRKVYAIITTGEIMAILKFAELYRACRKIHLAVIKLLDLRRCQSGIRYYEIPCVEIYLIDLVADNHDIKTTSAALDLMARMITTGHFKPMTRKNIKLIMFRITECFEGLASTGFRVLMNHIKIGREFNFSDMRKFIAANKATIQSELEDGPIDNKVAILEFLKVISDNPRHVGMSKPFMKKTLERANWKLFGEEEGWAVVCFLASCLYTYRQKGKLFRPHVINTFELVVVETMIHTKDKHRLQRLEFLYSQFSGMKMSFGKRMLIRFKRFFKKF